MILEAGLLNRSPSDTAHTDDIFYFIHEYIEIINTR